MFVALPEEVRESVSDDAIDLADINQAENFEAMCADAWNVEHFDCNPQALYPLTGAYEDGLLGASEEVVLEVAREILESRKEVNDGGV